METNIVSRESSNAILTGVGKTSLAKRHAEGTFSESPMTTINTSLFTRKSVQDGVEVRLQLWDTAGEEKHRSLTKLYYRGESPAYSLLVSLTYNGY